MKWCLIVIFDSYHDCVSSMVSIICLYLWSKCIKMLCPFNFFCWVIKDQLTLIHAPKQFKTNIFYLSKYIVAGVCHYWAGSRTSIPSVQIFDSYGSESEKRKHSSSRLFSVVLRNKLMYTYSWGLVGTWIESLMNSPHWINSTLDPLNAFALSSLLNRAIKMFIVTYCSLLKQKVISET